MPKLRDTMTSTELEQMERIQKKMYLAQTKQQVKDLYNQMQEIINHAKSRFEKLPVSSPLKIENVLTSEEQEFFQNYLRKVSQETDFNEVKKMTEALLEVFQTSERRYYQKLINQIENL